MGRRAAAVSLATVIVFAVAMHRPVFFEGKTVSAFDLAYRWGAFAGVKPPAFKRPANGLLSDPVVQFQAWDVAMFEGSLRFPWLWNPHAGFGSPLLANSQSAPLFPLKLVVYPLFGVRLGFGVVAFFKMALAGLLMWLYLRKLGLDPGPTTVGALAFMASGFMVAWLQWPHTNVAMVLPLFFYGAECLVGRERRRGFAAVAVAMAIGALGGHPETLFHAAFASGAYVAACALLRPRGTSSAAQAGLAESATLFLAAGVTGALLAAIQLIPAAEYIRHSAALAARSAAHQAPTPLTGLFSWGDLPYLHSEFLTYLLPNTFGNPSLHNHWWNKLSNYNESAGYVGIGTFALALFSWRYLRSLPAVRPLLAVWAIALGFVLRLPILCNTLGAIPPLSLAANKRFLLVFCFASAALAAIAAQEWRRAKRWTIADAIGLGLVVAFLSTLAFRRYLAAFSDHTQEWIQAYGRQGLTHFCVFLLLTVSALALARARGRAISAVAARALPLIVAVDLGLIHFGYNPFIEPERIYPATRGTEFLLSQGAARILPVDDHIGPNVPSAYGLDDPRMYDALTYRPLAHYLSRLPAVPGWNLVRQAPSPLTAIAGVRYLWAGADWTPPTDSVRLVFSEDKDRIYEDPAARPVAYLASSWESADQPDLALDMLTRAGPASELTVAEGVPAGHAPAGGAAPSRIRAADVVRLTPTRVRVDLPESAAGLLVLNDCFYPGWIATADGHPARLLRVNGTFRGVIVAPGTRRVEFTFAPPSFAIGAAVSAATLVVLLLATARWRSARRSTATSLFSPSQRTG